MIRLLLLKEDEIDYCTTRYRHSFEMVEYCRKHNMYQLRIEELFGNDALVLIACRSFEFDARFNDFFFNASCGWKYGYFHIYSKELK